MKKITEIEVAPPDADSALWPEPTPIDPSDHWDGSTQVRPSWSGPYEHGQVSTPAGTGKS